MTGFLELKAEDVEAMDEAGAQEVLAAWVKARRTELPEALAKAKSKLHARLAKKALYQLRSKGVTVAAAEPVKEPAPAPQPEPSDDFPAVISAFLGTGERAIYFARPVRGGGLDVYQGILNDTRGIMQLDRGEMNRGTYRRRMRELQHDPNIKVLLVPWPRMKLELGRTLALNEQSGSPLPKDADGLLRRLEVEPQSPGVLPEPLPEDAGLAAQGASLHQEKEISEWLPPEAHLKILTQRIDEVGASPLALSDAQKREALEQKVVLTAKELLVGDVRTIYARRLWYMADLFDATGREKSARLARAEARRLFHGTEPSAFAEQLYRKVLELAPGPHHAAPEELDLNARPGSLPAPGRLIVP